MAKGQLDHSPLTLHDLHTTRIVLAKALSGMYHQRVDYPAPAAETAPEPSPAA